MLIFSCFIKHIITYKNKILHKLFYTLFAPYNKKMKKYMYLYLNGTRILYLSFEKIYDKFDIFYIFF
jgi:hypothetical protein